MIASISTRTVNNFALIAIHNYDDYDEVVNGRRKMPELGRPVLSADVTETPSGTGGLAQVQPAAKYAGGRQRVRWTDRPLLPSTTIRLPMGSRSLATDSTGMPTPVPAPSRI